MYQKQQSINIIQDHDKYVITFKYDPELVQIIKQIPSHEWHPEIKQWSIGSQYLGLLVNQLKGTPYESCTHIRTQEQINVNASLDVTKDIPDYPFDEKELNLKSPLMKHQIDFMKWSLNRIERQHNLDGFLVADVMGAGKALVLNTLIYTPKGMMPIKDIHPGDIVFDMYGQKQIVLAEYNHDDLEMYKVTFRDNTSVICCKDHQWLVTEKGSYKYSDYKQVSTSQIIDGSFRKRKDARYQYTNYKIPSGPIIEFDKYNESDLYIDPWLLGFLIGDGSLHNSLQVAISYSELVQAVKDHLPKGYSLNYEYDIDYKIQRSDHTYRSADLATNEVYQEIKRLGLNTTAKFKFIPDIYKYNSSSVRLALVQGLLDSDRYVATDKTDKTCSCSFSTTSLQLAKDFQFVCESLGYMIVWHEYPANFNGKDCGTCYDLTIMIDDPNEIGLASQFKTNRAVGRHYCPRKVFKSIDYIGHMTGKCITVSGSTHTYTIEHGIVTHNTLSSISLALYMKKHYNYKHCLFIACVNSAKYNFAADIKKFTNEHPYMLGTRLKKKTGDPFSDQSSIDKYEDLVNGTMYGSKLKIDSLPYFIITNIESVRYGEGSDHKMMKQIIKMINSGYINMIILDEVHKNVSMTSMQGKMIKQIKKATGNQAMWIPMTGTPITSKPLDLYLPLYLIGANTISSFSKWKSIFCIYGGYGGYEIIGYKNIPQLKQSLNPNMIRRTKEILHLPLKNHITEYINLSSYQRRLYEKISQGIIENKDGILQELNPMTEFLKLRQVNGCPEVVDPTIKFTDKDYLCKNTRLQRLLDLVDDIIDANEKVIVFSNWISTLQSIQHYLRLKNIQYALYTGQNLSTREKEKQLFINDPRCKIFLGTIQAAGVSNTLTVATNVIFYDEPWDPAAKEQAEDRAHRIGQTNSVNIYTFVATNTIDERVEKILSRKSDVSNFIVDNKFDFKNNPDLFDYLLGHEKNIKNYT